MLLSLVYNKTEVLIFLYLKDYSVLLGLVWFDLVYGISTIEGYYYKIHFYAYKQFYFKQFSLAWV